MSLLRKVFNAVKKIFRVAVKRRKKPKKATKKIKKVIRVKKPSSLRKTKKVSAKKKTSPKKFKPAKSVPKKQTASVTQPKSKTSTTKSLPKLDKIGEVTHYFDKIKVCVIRIDKGTIKKGDRLIIEGNKGSLTQTVSSMQIENEDVAIARKGQLIGLKVAKEVYVADAVAKV